MAERCGREDFHFFIGKPQQVPVAHYIVGVLMVVAAGNESADIMHERSIFQQLLTLSSL